MTPLQRAFLALESARARIAELEAARAEPVAVIGLGCRTPGGGDDADSLWQLLRDGVDATSPLPADRWDVDAFFNEDPELPGHIASRRGGFLSQIDTFDPLFFGITRREAQGMDPQQRLLLEVCWEALEHACQPPDRLSQSATGVYVGLAASDYAYMQLQTLDRELLDAHFASGIAHSVASGRISYLLGLQGPSLTIDTACSSSLVAVHLACQALRAGECRMALAGGVNLILSPDLYIALSRSRMLAPDGRCKTFDAAADGFARAEGCGVVVLKRLKDAHADGDRILAVIRGTAVNQDGPSSGLTAPNGPAQEAVIREALGRAGLSPDDVGYIEAHGTGTQLGDPLEMTALGDVFGNGRVREAPLWVGSVKTNFGHLEAAAGVTGLIKCVLAMQHGAIPPHLHFQNPSPHIAWDELPVQVPTRLTPWQGINGRRVAGVSAFGFSGTNAHVVLEDAGGEVAATDAAATQGTAALRVFILSARSEAALAALAARCATQCAPLADASLDGLCRGAATGRAHHSWRAALLVHSMQELREQLQALSRGERHAAVCVAQVTRKDPARVALLFTGQGSQYLGMARDLYANQPVFREHLDRCAAVLDPMQTVPLRELLFAESGDAARLDETGHTQPALFAVEYALAQMWLAWGVKPVAVMGHSVGEYVAACLAGVFTLEDALSLIATRGRLMQSLPPGGAMAAVFADADRVAAALTPHHGHVSVAALNGPAQIVVSGKAEAVGTVCAGLQAEGVRCKSLPVSHAFHSALVDPVLEEFEKAAAVVNFSPPRLRVVSNLTGRVADAREITQRAYWRRHMREPVRFHEGLQSLAGLGIDVCLEVGPHPTLLAFAQAVFEEAANAPVLVATLHRDRSDSDQMAAALARMYLAGVDLDWKSVWASSAVRAISLPPYPFQREAFWFRSRSVPPGNVATAGRAGRHALLGTRLRSAMRDIVQFESVLHADDTPFLRDHNVQGRHILPATAFLELALEAGYEVLGEAPALNGIAIVESLQVAPGAARIVQVVLREAGLGAWTFEVLSCDPQAPGDDWQRHVEGRLESATGAVVPSVSLAEVRARCNELRTSHQHYQDLAARGLDFGPALRGVQSLVRSDGEALGEILLPPPHVSGAGEYLIHPALLDACIQVVSAALGGEAAREGRTYLPLAIDRVIRHRAPGNRIYSLVRMRETKGASVLVADVTLLDDNGPVAEVMGIALRMASASLREVYEVVWQPHIAEDAQWLPTPPMLAAQVGGLLGALLDEHDVYGYQRDYDLLERQCVQWIAAALHDLGWRPQVGQVTSTARVAAALNVLPAFHGALGRFLKILAEEGILSAEGAGWLVAKELPVDSLRDNPAFAVSGSAPRRILTSTCGVQLAGVLSGKVDPLHLLFPGGSADLAESLYRESPEAMALNQLIREAVRAMVAALPQGRRLRILEVGGGTGGTTAWVAPMLPADRTEYLFTDIGQFMVTRARDRFADHRFMTFQTLDLEKDCGPQGVKAASFDLILASNVIHATADLSITLRRLRSLLAPGGTLLMLEVAGYERWIDVTFGLTEGWWRFTDRALRPDYPLLSRQRWICLLQDCGFDAAAVSPEDPRTREVLLAARRSECPGQGSWLVLADAAGVGDSLAQRLAERGESVKQIPRDDQARGRIAAALAPGAAAVQGIVHLWMLDVPPLGDAPVEGQHAGLGSLLDLVQQLGAESFADSQMPRIWVASRGAQSAGAAVPNPEQASAWGMGRVIALEHPELRATRIDLDAATSVEVQAAALERALSLQGVEDQLAQRAGEWLVPRLAPVSAISATPTLPRRLEKSSAGVLDELHLTPAERLAPGPGQVQIRVVAAGLNFRDVMNAVAMREDPEPLGGECAGRISAVGEGVEGLAVGDHVVAVAEASFATYVVTAARHVAQIPAGLGFAQAATLPFAFMTAHHALSVLGKLQAGESLLVHAGAGGVGIAAIQLARRLGATVYATAGSDVKREFLRAMGVADVFDSRSLQFESQLLQATGGQGVDMVLNSLAGEFIAASVRCLKPAGRFLEIGKRDILTTAQFSQMRPNGAYHAIDLNAQRIQHPDASQRLFAEVIALAARGEVVPLPCKVFPMTRARDGFRHMAQARHIGKVVLAWDDAHPSSLSQLSAGAAYLVTGGLGGLGLLTAQRLVDRGARHLFLMGRSPPSQAARAAIQTMRAAGATVNVVQGDVSRRADVQRAVDAVHAAGVPLRGLIHSAGTLNDGALMQQHWEHFAQPLGPKIAGTWWLHETTRDLRLDFFVVYSSMAGVLGSAGQGNHAAANAFLDAFACHRRDQGLPAVSLAWGAWSEVGAAADRQVDRRVSAQGIDVITPARGLELLELLMEAGGSQYAIFPVQWEKFLARAPAQRTPFLDGVRPVTRRATRSAAAPVGPAAATTASMLEELREATPARREKLLLDFVREHVARVVAAPSAEAIDPREPLNEMGLDSLMAVDLRNRLGKGLGLARSLPATLVFDHPTVDALTRYLLKEVVQPLAASAAPVDATVNTDSAPDGDNIDNMSDEEVERLFAEKMKRS